VQFAARQIEKENKHHFGVGTVEYVCVLPTASRFTTPKPLSISK
jgi:hypothetical protein